MSIELVAEVLRYAPESLNPTERMLLIVIAESCNKSTRITWYRDGWDEAEVCRRVGIAQRSLSRTLTSLAKKGVEVRVPHGKTADGKPLYAFRGRQVTYTLPRLAPAESYANLRTNPEEATEKATQICAESYAEPRTNDPESYADSRTLLLKELPSKNTSSLSPRDEAAGDAPAPSDPSPETERETVEASPEEPKTEDPITRLLTDAGCPTDQLDDVREELTRRHEPRSPAWWRTTAKNGDLPGLIGEVLEALQPLVPALTAEHHADAHPFEPVDDGSPGCKRCGLPKPNGRHRVGNQGGGYVGRTAAGRSDRRGYTPHQDPADQSEYDDFSHFQRLGRNL